MHKLITLAALLLAISSSFVTAQERPVAQNDALDEIVVTSRRFEENLQDVPVSISAFTSADLDRKALHDIKDIANLTSNLTFVAGESGRAATPTIRGIGLIDGRGFDNPVGVFIDGIFVSGRATQNVSMLDLERVEVIKGPQSALYGRNTFSGAINYVTRPTPKEFAAKAEGTVGSDDLERFSGSIGGAVTDWMSARLAASFLHDNGTYRNAGPTGVDNGIGGSESKSVLLSMRFQPRDHLTIDVSGLWSQEFADNQPNNLQPNNCGRLDRTNPANANLISSDLANPIYFCGEAQPNGSGQLSMSPQAFSYDGRTQRGTVDVQWELPGGISMHSLSAYTTVNNYAQNDLDRTQAGDGDYGYLPLATFVAAGSPSFICSGFAPVGPCRGTAPLFNQIRGAKFNTYFGAGRLDTDYWSTELRFTSPRDQKLRWMAGLFYFRAHNDDQTLAGIDASEAVRTLGLPISQIKFLLLDRGAIIPGLSPMGTAFAFAPPIFPPAALFLDGPGLFAATWTPTVNNQKSLFGSVEYDFTKRFTGTAELRYNKEGQSLVNAFDNYFGSSGSYAANFSFTDPRVTMRFKATDKVMLYASAARGSRSGGINAAITDPAYVKFDPETNDTIELGFKSTFANGRIRVNAAVFQIDWKDAQFRQAAPSSSGNTGTLVNATLNVGGIKSKGLEVEVAAKLGNRFTVDANLGLSDPKFNNGTYAASLETLCRTTTVNAVPITCVGRDIDRNGTIDRIQPDISGKQIPRTSKMTASLGLEYAQPVFGDSKLVARVDAAYRSKQFADFINASWAPAHTRMNLRVGLEREKYDVYAWIENLTADDTLDQLGQNASTNLAASLAFQSVGINPVQRRYGLTGRVRF